MTLKFLVDEYTGKRLAILLENAGYDVVFVGDWKPSASDDEVLKKSRRRVVSKNEFPKILIVRCFLVDKI